MYLKARACRDLSGSGTDSVIAGHLLGSDGCEYAAAQEVEVGSAVHLAFDRFDAVDVPFDGRRCIEGSLVAAFRASAHGQVARATSVNAVAKRQAPATSTASS
jgi:hypothetical protein